MEARCPGGRTSRQGRCSTRCCTSSSTPPEHVGRTSSNPLSTPDRARLPRPPCIARARVTVACAYVRLGGGSRSQPFPLYGLASYFCVTHGVGPKNMEGEILDSLARVKFYHFCNRRACDRATQLCLSAVALDSRRPSLGRLAVCHKYRTKNLSDKRGFPLVPLRCGRVYTRKQLSLGRHV